MINVEPIPIVLTLPIDEVSVVAMQPYLDLQTDEPFKIRKNLINDQLNAIRKTLALAQNSFNNRSAHFTIFPEYSVPGLEGLEIIDRVISSANWSNGSVILAGTHGLTKDEFQEICERFHVTISNENNPSKIPDEKWINSCFMWIKENNGKVKRFIQLKIRPAGPEKNVTCNDMFRGSSIYVFNCNYINHHPMSFVTLICSDWVISLNSVTVQDEMLEMLQKQNDNVPLQLDWVFVIQNNYNPMHALFLNNTVHFLTDRNNFPLVQRDQTVLFHSNTAVSIKPSRTGNGAFSSCVFSPFAQLDLDSCRPTICMQPEILRGSRILADGRCKDIVFREMGQCIHRFKIKVPRFIQPNAAEKTFPILDAEVHAIQESTDPRISGKSIPASVKWLNDSLDETNSLAEKLLTDCSLFDDANALHPTIISNMRLIDDGIKIKNQINWARCYKRDEITNQDPPRCNNPDLWNYPDPIEKHALEHIVHTLTNIGLVFDLEMDKANFHGAFNVGNNIIQIISIQGTSSSDCRFHYDNNIPKETIDPVLVVISDRTDYKPTPREYKKYYEAGPDSGEKFLDYHTLVMFSRDADNVQNLKEKLDGYLPSDRRII